MSLNEVVIEGTLKPDGTLELDQKPNLAPGRVTVVLRQESETPQPPQEDWIQYLLRIRAEREAAGYPFMNEGSAINVGTNNPITVANAGWCFELDFSISYAGTEFLSAPFTQDYILPDPELQVGSTN